MKIGTLKISEIELDNNLYPRNDMDKKAVQEYARAMDNGEAFPSIYVAEYKKKYILIDGRHRIEANKLRGEKYIKCEIKSNFPNKESMYLAAIRSNLKHGVRFKKADRVKIGYRLRGMGYNIDDVTKLVGIATKDIKKKVMAKVKRVKAMVKINKGKLPGIIHERIANEVKRGPIVTKKEEEYIDEVNKAEWQILKLEEICDYIKYEKFETDNKKVCALITRIKKWLKKKYPKL